MGADSGGDSGGGGYDPFGGSSMSYAPSYPSMDSSWNSMNGGSWPQPASPGNSPMGDYSFNSGLSGNEFNYIPGVGGSSGAGSNPMGDSSFGSSSGYPSWMQNATAGTSSPSFDLGGGFNTGGMPTNGYTDSSPQFGNLSVGQDFGSTPSWLQSGTQGSGMAGDQTGATAFAAPGAGGASGAGFTAPAGVNISDFNYLDPTATQGGNGGNGGGGVGVPAPQPTNAQLGGAGANNIARSGNTGNNTSPTSSTNGINFKMDGGSLLGAAASGGMLLNNMLSGNKVPGQDAVNGLQGQVGATNAALQYAMNGTVTPAQQAQIASTVEGAKAQAASAMAARGLSADPMKNAALAQQFATIDQQALASQQQMANQLTQTGLQAVGLNSQTYAALQKIYADADKQQQQAVGNFATALGRLSGGGGNSGTTIRIGG